MTKSPQRRPREQRIAGAGGSELLVRSWHPEEKPRAVVGIVHGVKSHGGYFQWAAEQLVAAGLAVYALDLRGRGRSGGERLYIEQVDEYVDDVRSMLALARGQGPGVPVFLLGHSAGGVIASVYTLDNQAELAGLVCESFAFQVAAPALALAVVKGLSRVAPRLPVLRLANADFSRDPRAVRAMDDDPLVAREAQPAGTVAALVRATERLGREFGQIRLPVLILHGTADKVTRPDGSRRFHREAGSADKTLKLYEGHAHDLLNDVGREQVMADIQGWILARLPAVSRRDRHAPVAEERVHEAEPEAGAWPEADGASLP